MSALQSSNLILAAIMGTTLSPLWLLNDPVVHQEGELSFSAFSNIWRKKSELNSCSFSQWTSFNAQEWGGRSQWQWKILWLSLSTWHHLGHFFHRCNFISFLFCRYFFYICSLFQIGEVASLWTESRLTQTILALAAAGDCLNTFGVLEKAWSILNSFRSSHDRRLSASRHSLVSRGSDL